jgi:HK97 family phage prohead protease
MDKQYRKFLTNWQYDWDERSASAPTKKKISGHAAVFNRLSDSLGFFREKIQPGAFADCLRRKPDVRLLINHEGLPLARTKSGTLTLREDNEGLFFEAAVDESDPDIQRIVPKMQRGDLSQMSIGFYVISDSWEVTGKTHIRTLQEVDLFDVSLVTYPAYPQTSATIRGAQEVFQTCPATVSRARYGADSNTVASQLRAQAAARQRHLYLLEKII